MSEKLVELFEKMRVSLQFTDFSEGLLFYILLLFRKEFSR